MVLAGSLSGAPDDEAGGKEIFHDGLAQLASTIEALETGVMVVPGLPDKVTAYYPVLFTLEPFVMWPMTYQRITERVHAAGVSFGRNVRPWQLIEIGDLEFLEVAVSAGRSLADLLREKTDDEGYVGLSMANFMTVHQDNVLSEGVNPFLSEQPATLLTASRGRL